MRVVIVAGAGASSRLGVGGAGLPLMKGWCSYVCEALGAEQAGLLELHNELEGDEFEERIGKFLAFGVALPTVAEFPRAGILSGGALSLSEDQMRQWFTNGAAVVDNVRRVLFGSLHDLFGRHKVDENLAAAAYKPLLDSLGANDLTFATTNYDVAGEVALDVLGRRPYAGIDVSSLSGLRPVHFDDLCEQPGKTPVLYLHGRVGWYRRPDGSIVAADPAAPYDADRGVPALLLPDPLKPYDAPETKVLWAHFEELVKNAERVLVLGHSLHDDYLVAALRQVRDENLGIAVHCPSHNSGSAAGEMQALRGRLERSPHMIAMDFGPDLVADQQQWAMFRSGNNADTNRSGSMAPLAL